MKNYILIIAMLCVSSIVMGQTPTENYIKSTSSQVPVQTESAMDNLSNDEKLESITYYDGLGRPKQSIIKQGGGQHQDIINYFEYDSIGRQSRQYLPYANTHQAQTSANLNYRDQNTLLENIRQLYFNKYSEEDWLDTEAVNAFSETLYEYSPINRALEQGAPGAHWIANDTTDTDHTIKFEYGANTTGEVPMYDVIFPTGSTEVPSLYFNDYYQENELSKVITKDENWQPNQTHENDHTTEEFKDKQGRVVLKRTYNNGSSHDTQYVYDDYGNLTYVLSPKGSDQIISSRQQRPRAFNYNILEGRDGASITPDRARRGAGVTTTGQVVVTSYAENGSNYFKIDFNVNFSQSTVLKTGAIAQLAHSVPDVFIGTLQAYGGEYTIGIKDQTLYFSGSGTFTFINQSLTVELPTAISTTALEDLCYQYHYDHKNRLIEKKIPGKGWESIVYDKLDRPVLTQDALLDAANQWLFTKYDALGRVVYTGITSSTKTRSSMQSTVNNQNTLYETSGSTTIDNVNTYYTNNAYPQSISELHTINYYDTYNDALLDVATNPQTVLGQDVSSETKSLPTGSKARVLTDAGSHWVTTVNYYDNEARPIYTASHNGYLNTTDIIETELDFTGKVLQTKAYHTKNGTTITVEDTFAYDHASRLLTQEQQVNNQTAETIVSNTYDALGQLITKGVGGSAGSPLQNVDYTYNIRGWLKQINDVENLNNDLFSFQLNYANNASVQSDSLFNGNIADALWKTANDNTLYSYNYRYDALNRITDAVFNGGNKDDRYNLAGVSYDKNGNHYGFKRNGHLVENPVEGNVNHFGTMDYLKGMRYKGNQLLKVTDSESSNFGFKDGTNTNDDFEYDPNGNMILDRNKGISSIAYNHLNLPIEVVFDNNQNKKITYIYDAAGSKHEKQVNDLGNITNTVYAGNYIYENTGSGDALKFFSHPEGYAEPNGFGFDYVYQYKDHLGNIRLSYKDISTNYTPNLQIVEENNYYPFGLEHKGYNNTIVGAENKHFTYVGKELNESLSYNMLEMDWRHYDPAIARFVSIDAFAESYEHLTPYHYSENSPVMYSDPTGLFTDVVNEETGETYHVDDGYDFEWTVSADTFNTITEAGEIPDNLKWARTKEFWRQVWAGVVKSDGSASDEITAFLITDDINDVGEVIANEAGMGNMAIGVALAIGAGKLKKLKKLARWAKKKVNRGKKIPGTKKGGVPWANDGRDGGAILPKKDANGKPITYTEYDINKAPQHGATRGKERMVVGSDGRTYYTRNHYESFREFKD